MLSVHRRCFPASVHPLPGNISSIRLGFLPLLLRIHSYMFWMQVLCWRHHLPIRFPGLQLVCLPPPRGFHRKLTFASDEINVHFHFPFSRVGFVVKSENSLPHPRSREFSPVFFKSWIASRFTSKSTIHSAAGRSCSVVGFCPRRPDGSSSTC